MKYCPYCGASIPEGSVSFCVECGKKLPPQSAKILHKAREKATQRNERDPSPTESSSQNESEWDSRQEEPGYDGYYDDITPPDTGRTQEGIDKELVKRIILVCASVFGIIGISIAMMYFL